MILQLVFSLALASLTVVVHAIGTVRIVMALAAARERWERDLTSARTVLMLIRLVAGLLVLHLAEMGVWAVAIRALAVMPSFEASLYYSLESYTTVGYGDVTPREEWRLVGPIESAVGILMFGWSTGIIVAVLQRIYRERSSA